MANYDTGAAVSGIGNVGPIQTFNGQSYGSGNQQASYYYDSNGNKIFYEHMGQIPADQQTGNFKPQQMTQNLITRKALVEAAKKQVFQKLATEVALDKHSGKWLTRNVWYPVLDDRNKNDQGIDATGAAYNNGNMYGSSKDIATISGKLPKLDGKETGGRYNRIGFTKSYVEGTIAECGFFFEVTEDMLTFDSDAELYAKMTSEAMKAANEITEDILQIQLIQACTGAQIFSCALGTSGTGDANFTHGSVITYENLLNIAKILEDNHVPKVYKMLTGSTYTDTKTVEGGWTIYCGNEMRETFYAMKNPFSVDGKEPAFKHVHEYAASAGSTIVEGELGRVGPFRIVEVPEMMHWADVGGNVDSSNADGKHYYSDGGEKYNVYPLLIIGPEAFNTIGFRSESGKSKFRIYSKMPGEQTASFADPYGRRGFWSIQWKYGFIQLRPERMLLIKSLALKV